ncbi:MAG: PD40 domain-containing protein [Ktedonobacteraceae bacterium]|nr:PD40 domain-containing protein [Ktedonobacteraceae bacterium]
MKRNNTWQSLFLLMLVALCLQSCLGIGDTNNTGFKQTGTGGNTQVGVNQHPNLFKGKFYFTVNRNMWVLDGSLNLHQLTSGRDVRDPAISPDGKRVAFIVHYKFYNDLEYMSVNTGPWHMLKSGNGKYFFDPALATPKNTFAWYAQPAWAPDNTHLLFLSDFEKEKWYGYTHIDAPILDMQVFSMSVNNPGDTPQDVAYAYFGDGGNRDAMYRPGHANQIIYTHYGYDKTHTQQVIQLYLEAPNMVSRYPRGTYYPGAPGKDPAVAITPASAECIQPAFSPDGNSIAYIKRESDGQMGLYVMPVPENVTSHPNDPNVVQQALQPYKQSTRLLKQAFISQPVWSPDGKQIAYLSYNNEEFDIWLAALSVNPQTGASSIKGTPVQLTSGGIDGDSRPAWTT